MKILKSVSNDTQKKYEKNREKRFEISVQMSWSDTGYQRAKQIILKEVNCFILKELNKTIVIDLEKD